MNGEADGRLAKKQASGKCLKRRAHLCLDGLDDLLHRDREVDVLLHLNVVRQRRLLLHLLEDRLVHQTVVHLAAKDVGGRGRRVALPRILVPHKLLALACGVVVLGEERHGLAPDRELARHPLVPAAVHGKK